MVVNYPSGLHIFISPRNRHLYEKRKSIMTHYMNFPGSWKTSVAFFNLEKKFISKSPLPNSKPSDVITDIRYYDRLLISIYQRSFKARIPIELLSNQ
jgi:hypothetical protein